MSSVIETNQVDQATSEPLLSIENLSKSFYMHMADRRINGCQNITLAVNEGEFVGITGRSGSGKSTILRCIYRTNLPESGSIWYRSASFGKVDLCTVGEREMIHIRAYEMGYVSQFL
ncbi:MAG: ATP-binding cassette domain-containing protein, partial [Eggerthellaceae bacterium]|nr:ATP-binding cassette domain-containing protein [Eggerthellaceae bacterium]